MVTYFPFLVARITEENDFLRLKELAISPEGWRLDYDKHVIKIWSRVVADANIKMFKVWAVFSGVNSTDLYHSLMDPIYRKQWDSHVIVAYEIGLLNKNNAIIYYAASCPPPLKSRDFVLQTSWFDMKNEYFILNHSVCHKDHPPRPGFIRAISYFTGYYIRPVIDDGAEMTFVSQTDPQGYIPAWLVNKCTQIFAPRFIRQIEAAAYAYRVWKTQNNPDYYPWVNPEQMRAPEISIGDCVPSAEERQSHFFRNLSEKYMAEQAKLQKKIEVDTYNLWRASMAGSSKVSNIEQITVPDLQKSLGQSAKTQYGKKRKQKRLLSEEVEIGEATGKS